MYHVFVTYETTRYLCNENEKQNQISTFDWFSPFNVFCSFKKSLAPPAAPFISTLQHTQWNLFLEPTTLSARTWITKLFKKCTMHFRIFCRQLQWKLKSCQAIIRTKELRQKMCQFQDRGVSIVQQMLNWGTYGQLQ